MSNGLATKMSVAIFSLLIGSMIFLLVVFIYPFEPITFHEAILITPSVKAGYAIEIISCFDKYTDKPGTMTRFLVAADDNGGQIITLSGPIMATAKKGDSFKVVRIDIPSYVPSGRYFIRWMVAYNYFGLRTVFVESETPVFTVEK
jgi:hypothetical protein